MRRPRPLLDRIADLTDRSAGPDACWPWKGCRVTRGYGGIRQRGPGGTIKYLRVCRIVLAEKLGRPLGRKEVARHRCDNPPCVNPAHLEPGTNADNSADAVARGRTARGSRSGVAKLTEADAIAIFRRLGAGASHRKCARVSFEYGVSPFAVYALISGRTWNHVTGLPQPGPSKEVACRFCGRRRGHALPSCREWS